MVNDPLHIASSDHPGMMLTNTPLNERFFLGWSRTIKMALGAKVKLGFIVGSLLKSVVIDGDYQSCGKLRKCTCVVTEKFIEIDTRSKMMQFLIRLNDDFEAIRNQILSMDPLPNLNKAYYIV
ncbi:sulfotransferase 16 [Tanacetum coccineum]